MLTENTLIGDSFQSDFITAARSGSVQTVIEYLETNGLESALAGNSGNTAIMSSIFEGHEGVVDVLYARTGIDIDVQSDQTGFTALMWAAYWGKEAIAESLLKKGAKCDPTNSRGETALALATKNGFRSVANVIRTYCSA